MFITHCWIEVKKKIKGGELVALRLVLVKELRKKLCCMKYICKSLHMDLNKNAQERKKLQTETTTSSFITQILQIFQLQAYCSYNSIKQQSKEHKKSFIV